MGRPRRSQETREKLIEQGLAVLLRQGYHGTGLQEILDQVGVPKGSFYNYFQSKEDYGAEIIRTYTQRALARIDAALAGVEDPVSALRAFFQDEICRRQQGTCQEGCLLGCLGNEMGASSELCRQALHEGFDAIAQRFTRLLTLAQQKGSVRQDVPAPALAQVLLSAWQGALMRMKVEASVEPLRQLADVFLDRFLTV